MLNFIKIPLIRNFRKICLEFLKRIKSHETLFKSYYIPYGTGQQAEKTAQIYLEKRGLKFIQRNFRCRMGEIDLIMKNGNEIVFVEVRMRSSNFISALETITSEKKRKIVKTAVYYLQRRGLFDKVNYRFDVIAIDIPTASGFSTRRRGASRRSVYQIHEDGERRRQQSGKFNREGYKTLKLQWIKYAF